MSLDDVVHPQFTFLLIPQDIDSPVQELQFKGREEDFREQLKTHLNREKINCLNQQRFKEFKQGLKEKSEGKIGDEGLERMVQGTSQNYQVLIMTSGLPSRASVQPADIRGDCFLSCVFDDEENFQRVNCGESTFQELMQNPPDAKGRWSETQAAMQLLQQTGQAKLEGGAFKAVRTLWKELLLQHRMPEGGLASAQANLLPQT
ncbi:zinc finger mynd domain-containing protein [Cyclospora cayetanensis]|uniref:Zinc finger mynd domain-containing protein n=1 Tax=Cyclospora cayetanensis TaxID=88456 RepID=A0A1D3DA36_9EIME|nr:zinc finger mynd domain-containing protein [Cyclospora cayetanensis]